jgi:hypothetical protein
MNLIYSLERAAGDDKWFHRQDITDKTPGEWLADQQCLRGCTDDIILVNAMPISDAEGYAIKRYTAEAMDKRRELLIRGKGQP